MNHQIVATADGSSTLFSEQYGETFHSVNGAVTESRHVFLEACQIRQRLESNRPTRILEIGFGLGLNCLLTLDLAIENGASLDYHSVEANPIAANALQELDYADHLTNKGLPEALFSSLLKAPPAAWSKFSAIPLYKTDSQVNLHIMDATVDELPVGPFDAIFLDPFSPDTNPECWTVNFMFALHQRLSTTGIMSTYSAKGAVRRSMQQAGFIVNKVPGPPGKREMLIAKWPQQGQVHS